MGLNQIVKIGDHLKKIRMSMGISQKEMANKLGIAYTTYSNYENNNRTPNEQTLQMIAESLNVTVYDLTGIVPASTIAESEEENDYFREHIEPILEKMNYKIGAIVSKTSGNEVELITPKGETVKVSTKKLIDIDKDAKQRIEPWTMSQIEHYIDSEIEFSKIAAPEQGNED